MSKSAAISIVQVPFHGDVIEAVQQDGKILVGLRRVCESLGLAYQPQHRKLTSPDCDWAGITMMVTPDERGRPQRQAMIDAESLPMWLVTISPSKVKVAAREKLRLYKREARAVLSAWFLGTSAAMPELAREIVEIRRRLEHVESMSGVWRAKTHLLAGEVRDQAARLDSIARPFGKSCSEYMTFREYAAKYDLLDDLGRRPSGAAARLAGRSITSMSAALNIPVYRVPGLLGPVNAYRIDVLAAWRINHDLRSRLGGDTFEKVVRGRIFSRG